MFTIENPYLWVIGVPALGVLLFFLGSHFSAEKRERQVLEKGISNLEFHYLGSAKILGGIGKGLAEAMAELNQLKTTPTM